MATHLTSCRSRRSGPKGFGAAVTWRQRKNSVSGSRGRREQEDHTHLWLYRFSQCPMKKPLLLLPFKALTAP